MDGSVRWWIGTLPDDLVAGGSLLLDLTMTKFEGDDVVIGYEVVVSPTMALIFDDGFETADTSAWSSTQQ